MRLTFTFRHELGEEIAGGRAEKVDGRVRVQAGGIFADTYKRLLQRVLEVEGPYTVVEEVRRLAEEHRLIIEDLDFALPPAEEGLIY